MKLKKYIQPEVEIIINEAICEKESHSIGGKTGQHSSEDGNLDGNAKPFTGGDDYSLPQFKYNPWED